MEDFQYQTIGDFMKSPFGLNSDKTKDDKYNKSYQLLKRKIYVKSVLEIDKFNYMIHMKIPSESNNTTYDVVLHFFTDDKKISSEMNFIHYYVKFFSNSPSFVYQFSALYNKCGFLISSLVNKFDIDVLNKLPEKTNSNHIMCYDKSIYLACKFMLDNPIKSMNKFVLFLKKTTNKEKFLAGVEDIESIKNANEVSSFEKSLKKEFKKEEINMKKHKQPINKSKGVKYSKNVKSINNSSNKTKRSKNVAHVKKI